ncbi:MAG: transporter substrate-binding domain-containing protein [Oscillospiraceae bacterium]|nr:transporter substrate-binding domain-containing protein [Oscillospiraceae bacterium]
MKIIRNSFSVLLILAIAVGLLAGCNSATKNDIQESETFEQAKIGVITGSSHDGTAKHHFPNAERVYFNSMADMIIAVEQDKIDCYIEDAPFVTALIWEGVELKRLDEAVSHVENGFVFPEGESTHLREQLNSFLSEAKADGTVEQLKKKWMGAAEPNEHPDYMSLSGENGTIRLAMAIDGKPLLYQRENYYTGLEMELLTLFAQKYGYSFDIEVIPFESIIAGIAAGKYDMGSAALNITPEREESVDFSEPYAEFDVVLVTKGATNAAVGTAKKLADFEEATIGVLTGSVFDDFAAELFPNSERQYFTLMSDMILAVEQDKVDGFISENTYVAAALWEGANIEVIPEPIAQTHAGYILKKDESSAQLREQLDQFILGMREDGSLQALNDKWLGSTEPTEHPNFAELTGENGTLRVAAATDLKPISYIKNGELSGYEMELLWLFAKQYGYDLEISNVTFETILPGVTTGKYDIGTGAVTITEERARSVDFTESHLTVDVVMVAKKQNAAVKTQGITSLKDIENAAIAIWTGTIWDEIADRDFPNAEKKYFSTSADILLALEQGKVDVAFFERPLYVSLRWENAPVTALETPVGTVSNALILTKEPCNEVLLGQLNDFIAKSKQDGTLEALENKWFADTEPTEHPDYERLAGENGTIRVAVENGMRPLTYRYDHGFTGYEVEMLTIFAREYGYRLEIEGMAFDALIPSVASGKFDIGASGITVTPERAESVRFTDSHVSADGLAVVYTGAKQEAEAGFWDEIKEDFNKTFVREDRWKLLLEGIGITMLISICAAIAGTLVGFGLYMLSRSDVKLLQMTAKGIAKVYSRIIAGTPVVVILMILFYVVFGKLRDMSGIVVAIIGFALTFGAFVYDHMTVSVGSVDRGQTEAAYALGYTKNKTFFRIIFPQAMSVFLPSYCGQAVELIKATAVVGYIAVNDLTKMGDIIRSNTYEAFFPLIATAVIYFILTWILSLLLSRIKVHFEPKRRKPESILKGVKTE